MKKTKVLSILVVVLAIVNIGLILFLVVGIPPQRGPGMFKDQNPAEAFIKEKFKFDDDQMKAFNESMEKHKSTTRATKEALDKLSRKYYMSTDTSDKSERDGLLDEIGALSNDIYIQNMIHFDEVRNICNEDQVLEMEGFIRSLLKGSHRNKGPKRRMHKE